MAGDNPASARLRALADEFQSKMPPDASWSAIGLARSTLNNWITEATRLASEVADLEAENERLREGQGLFSGRTTGLRGAIKRDLERDVGGPWNIVDGCIDAMMEGGIIGWVARLRRAHHAIILTALRHEAMHQFEGHIYSGCSCGDIRCDVPLWLTYAQRLIDSYEAKVADFATETPRLTDG